ncbi:ATP-binding protein [Streptomyces sp. M41]|uniref:ATP-binding protein n=1 Tax=Streptomyces sp. M41 TaxID=3059412 RepID=UPI00374D73CC
MIEIPDLVTGGLAVGTLSALALGGGLVRTRRQQARQRAEIDALHRQLQGAAQAFAAEVEHLAEHRLPAAARQLAHPHVTVPGPLYPGTTGTPLGAGLEQVLSGLRTELTAQRTRIDAAAQAGMRGATREIQAALYRLQDALRGLQQKYDEPELTQTLFELDHENEQSLRRAQVAAVVCGAWVGLAREESHLVDAVTGGQARLSGYHRVRVHNHLAAGTALVSHAVEPVAIIVAELLDNALRHSAPDTDVVVNLEHVHHGVCVTVDDAGLGMTQDERARAQRLVGGSEPILLTELGDPPRMGLAAIGQLTRQFDLGVDVSSPSPYGGVRAVLRVDSHLLSRIDPVERPPAASAPRSTRIASRDDGAAQSPGDRTVQSSVAAEVRKELPVEAPRGAVGDARRGASPAAPGHRVSRATHGYGDEREDAADPAPGHHTPRAGLQAPDAAAGLPQRRRRTRVTSAPEEAPAPRPAVRRPEQAAAALGALQAGTSAGRAASGDPAGNRAGDAATDVPGTAQGQREQAEAAGPGPGTSTSTSTSTDQTDHEHEGGTAR